MEDLIKGELDWHNKVNENFHEVDSQMADMAINHNLKGDWNGVSGTDNLQELISVINGNPTGGTIYLNGKYFISDESQLPHKIENFKFIGPPNTVIVFGKVLGENTNTRPVAYDVVNWTNCIFENITFSAPNATEYAIFTSGSEKLKFYACKIHDVKSHFIQSCEKGIFIYCCNFTCSDELAGTCLQTVGNVKEHFMVLDCDWNFAPSQNGGCLISATNQDNLIGDYWFINNRFLTDNKEGYYIDACIDLEPNSDTLALRNVHIENCISYNSKIYIGSVDNLYYKDSEMHFNNQDSNFPAGYPIALFSSYATAPIGKITIDNVSIYEEDKVGYQYKIPIYCAEKNTINKLVIKNCKLYLNGKLNSGDSTIILIDTSGGNLDTLIIKNNDFYATSIPNVKAPMIKLQLTSQTRINNAEIYKNTLHSENSFTAFIAHGNYSGAGTIDVLDIQENDMRNCPVIIGSSNQVNKRIYKNNSGLNPISINTPVTISDSDFQNIYGCSILICIPSGTSITNVFINSIDTGISYGTFLLEPNDIIKITYTTTAAWKWIGR